MQGQGVYTAVGDFGSVAGPVAEVLTRTTRRPDDGSCCRASPWRHALSQRRRGPATACSSGEVRPAQGRARASSAWRWRRPRHEVSAVARHREGSAAGAGLPGSGHRRGGPRDHPGWRDTGRRRRDGGKPAVARYDPANGTWRRLPSLPAVRGQDLHSVSAVRWGSRILVAETWQHVVHPAPGATSSTAGVHLLLLDATGTPVVDSSLFGAVRCGSARAGLFAGDRWRLVVPAVRLLSDRAQLRLHGRRCAGPEIERDSPSAD